MSTPKLDLKRYRQRLLELRQSLREVQDTGDDAAATVELDQTRQGRLSRMDALQAQAMSVEAKRRREERLREVGAALARLDSNDFGWCGECGDAIDPRRLDHDPAARLCIGCAENAERA
ncbi:MAG: TraR/DksA family transcriptional regulator [Gammaproteobacteria bacterium]